MASHIWHYGHVRDERAYKLKNARQRKYHESGFKLIRKNLKRIIKSFLFPEKTRDFKGVHPKVMKERIQRIGGE